MALSTILFPWANTLWQLWLISFLYGFGVGCWNSSNNVVLIEIWKHRSPTILLLCHMLWGLGTILGPLLIEPYIIGNDVCPGVTQQDCKKHSFNNQTINEFDSQCNQWCLAYDRRPLLKIPFIIGGVLEIFGPIISFIMFFVKRYHNIKDESLDESKSDETKHEERERRLKYIPKWTILTCVSIIFLFGILVENLYNSFAATFFQYQPVLHVSASKASIITSTMNGAFTFGRVVCAIAALYVSPQNLILIELIITLGGYIFQLLGQNQLTLLWISSIILGLGFASVWVSCFSFIARYMILTDVISGWYVGPCNITYIVLGYFISHFMESNPSILLYLSIAGISISIVAHLVQMYAVRNVPRDLILNIDLTKSSH
ncbi:major facilitator superfamily domain-containing protein 4B-like [Oppia nitens]|uniref:major facilitator superfamily domain-containing protein 4B-like n=1 Tax=Oppia nitens TaxID=1686743 RepID=UPI0023DC3A13|nr:major facilitator superfamily domain-containing protein 4B-like [Oppia nitens]